MPRLRRAAMTQDCPSAIREEAIMDATVPRMGKSLEGERRRSGGEDRGSAIHGARSERL